ncbi:MAG: GDSL-type esterase/lipase family protein [Planctomycetota bacterium]
MSDAPDTSPVLFVGSSIFEQWTRSGDAVDGPSINAAIGGTTSRDWVPRLPALLDQHRPRMVICYAGSNDFNNDIAPDETLGNLLALAEMTVPRCRFVYTSIIRSPAKHEQVVYLAKLEARWAQQRPAGSAIIDINPVFFDGDPRDGTVRQELFVEDGIHLTAGAYDELTEFARPLLATQLQRAGR